MADHRLVPEPGTFFVEGFQCPVEAVILDFIKQNVPSSSSSSSSTALKKHSTLHEAKSSAELKQHMEKTRAALNLPEGGGHGHVHKDSSHDKQHHDDEEHEKPKVYNRPPDEVLNAQAAEFLKDEIKHYSLPEGDDVVKQGWIYKQGDHFKTWRRRYFVMNGNSIKYFTSEKTANCVPKGVLEIRRGCMELIRASDCNTTWPKGVPLENCFGIAMEAASYVGGKRVFFVYASSAVEANEWKDLISKTSTQIQAFRIATHLANLDPGYDFIKFGIVPNAVEVYNRENQAVPLPDAFLVCLIAYSKLLSVFANQIPQLAKLPIKSHITYVMLPHCGLTSIPNEVFFMPLRGFDLEGNLLETLDLPPNHTLGTHMCLLNLAFNKLTHIPDGISTCYKLTWFILDGNRLTCLPPCIAKLNLQTISLAGNPITSPPREVWDVEVGHIFRRLVEYFSDHDDTNSSVHASKAVHLLDEASVNNSPYVDLSSLRLKDVPQTISFSSLTTLVSLNLNQNLLTTLPREIGLLHSLSELRVRSNRLHTIPPQIADLKSLRFLDLSCNRLKTLPIELSQNTNLEECHLAINEISVLPPIFTNLTKLRCFTISHNKLVDLPQNISKATALDCVEFANNLIEELPSSIVNLTNLKNLGLWGNPLRVPPLPLCMIQGRKCSPPIAYDDNERFKQYAANIPSIFGYFHDLERCGSAVSNRLKVLVVGRAECGKTSLVHSLVHAKPSLATPLDRTLGINLIRHNPSTSSPLELVFWDFAGQEDYYQTHQFFLTPCALYLLVFSLSKYNLADEASFDHFIAFWLKSIHSRVPDATVLIVATCADECPPDEARAKVSLITQLVQEREADEVEELNAEINYLNKAIRQSSETTPSHILQRRLAEVVRMKESRLNIHPQILVVSNASLDGHEALQKTFIDIAYNPKNFAHVGQKLPKSYLALERESEKRRSEGTTLLSWDDYCAVAREIGITNDKETMRAVSFLNILGEVLHFEDVSSLTVTPSASSSLPSSPPLPSTQPTTVPSSNGNNGSLTSDTPKLSSSSRSSSLANVSTSVKGVGEGGEGEVQAASVVLSQNVFLDPQWLLNSMKSVIRHDIASTLKYDKKVRDGMGPREFEQAMTEFLNEGIISFALLRRLWRSLHFSDETVALLRDVMQAFEICYTIPRNAARRASSVSSLLSLTDAALLEDKSLVPCYLPDTNPRIAELWSPLCPPSCIQVTHRFYFPHFIPPGLVERLIVRTHDLAQFHHYSKHGGLVQIGNTMIYFLLDIHSSTLDISARFPESISSTRAPDDFSSLPSSACREGWNTIYAFIMAARCLLLEWAGVMILGYIVCPHCIARVPVESWTLFRSEDCENTYERGLRTMVCVSQPSRQAQVHLEYMIPRTYMRNEIEGDDEKAERGKQNAVLGAILNNTYDLILRQSQARTPDDEDESY